MPFEWTSTPQAKEQTLRLWPYQSLPLKGMAAFVLATFTMICLPLIMMLGSVLMWGLLPFALAAVWGIYFALRKNHASRLIEETLSITEDEVYLNRRAHKKPMQEWRCNRYWTKVTRYKTEGPIPEYITLRGNGREAEIGAFLSEEERVTLYEELRRALP